jgi:hypothetical protein
LSTSRDAQLRATLRDPSGTDAPLSLVTLCQRSADLLGMDGATIVLLADGASAISASNDRAAALADLQFALGQGPTPDATASNAPVSAGDIAARTDRARWPELAPAVADLGVGAIFAFPLRVGAIRLGVLSLDRTETGLLEPAERTDALIVADAVTDFVLDDQAGVSGAGLSHPMAVAAGARAVVHQASGMISVQVDGNIRDALIRLRAHAYAHEQPIDVVAAQVVDGDLRFGPENR